MFWVISSMPCTGEITQNIGSTQNQGLEIGLRAVPVQTPDFQWDLQGNLSLNRNKIVSLLTDTTDDVGNRWFIGEPIDVNYAFVFDGIWQEGDDFAGAAQPDAQPGYARILDVNGDSTIDADDRMFIGSRIPSFIWGLTNTFTYKNFTLNVFIHGVQGITRRNSLVNDDVFGDVRRNTLLREYWTPENPINTFWANDPNANNRGVSIYENASFIRLKDVTLSYRFPQEWVQKIRLGGLSLYVNGRNLATITEWTGLDPELSGQRGTPLQRVMVLGANVSF